MLYEWGGQNLDGTPGFEFHRPGWGKPVHQLLAEAGASVVFHGHDHVFVKQELDGIVYQECPRPNFPRYTDVSNAARYGYVQGLILPNSGHLRVSVARDRLSVDYVRAYLAGGGTNGEVACTYTVPSRLPLAAFESTTPSPVSGRAVSFSDASTGNPTAWSWTFGDGGTSTLQSPTHTYGAPGAYEVSLTVSNAYGSDTTSRSVSVTPASTITSVVKATSPFRLKVYGAGFQAGCRGAGERRDSPADYLRELRQGRRQERARPQGAGAGGRPRVGRRREPRQRHLGALPLHALAAQNIRVHFSVEGSGVHRP